MRYVLGIDLGTTALKAALFDENGKQKGACTQEYTLKTPQPTWVELDCNAYLSAFQGAISQTIESSDVDKDDIAALAISAQGETIFFLDENGKPLRDAIVWMDNRATEEAEELQNLLGGREIVHHTTGQVEMCATWPAAKILWVKKHQPEIFRQTKKFLLIEDLFIYWLTGQYVAEDSLLCSTMYFDINTRTYWPQMLDALGISESQLPEIRLSGTTVANISQSAAQLFGLSQRTMVCMGGLDQACGAIGVGNVRAGIFTESTGAALATVAITDKPMFDEAGEMPCFAGAIPHTYMIHSFSTGGMVMRWFRDNFCDVEMSAAKSTGINAYTLIDKMVESVAPGADGLLMIPHLQGSGPPDTNSYAKGCLHGLTLGHTRSHMARAIMEGVAMVLLRMKEATEAMGVEINEIRSLSGGAQSAAWCQIKADASGCLVKTMKNTESAACLGAAILAGVAIGMWEDVQGTAEAFTFDDKHYTPRPAHYQLYAKKLEHYKSLLHELEHSYERS